jgi:hypothetical protein
MCSKGKKENVAAQWSSPLSYTKLQLSSWVRSSLTMSEVGFFVEVCTIISVNVYVRIAIRKGREEICLYAYGKILDITNISIYSNVIVENSAW